MSIVAVLIPVTLVLLAFGIWAFFWAVRTGQFEELDVPGWEILLEERGDPGPDLSATAEPPADTSPVADSNPPP